MASDRARSFFAGVRKRTWVVLGSATALILAGGAAALILLSQQSAAQAAPVTRNVAASLETLDKSVEATGTLTPAVQESVSFVASGTVTKVAVEAGDTVEAGQTLATVDTITVEAELLQAQADLADAEAQLSSAQSEDDGSVSSAARISARGAAVTVAQQQVESAREAVSGATLQAPVAGLVTAVSLSVGDVVTGSSSGGGTSGSDSSGTGSGGTGSGGSAASGQGGATSAGSTTGTSSESAQFTIVGTEAWEVSVSVGESEIGLIEAGDQVELETAEGTQLFGVVDAVGKLPSTSSGSAAFPVTIAITGTAEGLFDGTSVTAAIVYERRHEVLTVPSAAVSTDPDGTSTVTLIDDAGGESQREVTVGEVSGDLTEITDGLAEGDLVQVAVFTPGEGDSAGGGQMPGLGGGEMPDPGSGQMPDFGDGQMPDFGGARGGQ